MVDVNVGDVCDECIEDRRLAHLVNEDEGNLNQRTQDEVIQDESSTNRMGTVSSACFNLLSTMVGGGSLSLPLAFQQAGNGLIGPILLLVSAMITDFCFRILVASSPKPNAFRRGHDSFESIAFSAFGSKARIISTLLVYFMCFFGTVGYAVLLRDMLEPLSDAVWPDGSRFTRNLAMLLVVILVTPLCGLENLSSLENFGATSMVSVLILGTCVIIRSFQCVVRTGQWDVKLLPESPRMLLNSLPLFVSCFVCHYNVHPVHNELKNPTPHRVSRWLRLTTWSAAAFYIAIGFSGSLYAACTPDGHVTGNILLSFENSDPLLFIGRMCLALTITLAFPMLTIPARDIVIRSWKQGANNNMMTDDNDLEEPLLENSDVQRLALPDNTHEISTSLWTRLSVATIVFWSGAAVACCVSSIDVVWDLLGSSLSILLSILIPCGSYLVLVSEGDNTLSRVVCFTLLGVFVPLMFISTWNAIMNTFFIQFLPDFLN
jgi:amino acid permease